MTCQNHGYVCGGGEGGGGGNVVAKVDQRRDRIEGHEQLE